MTVAASVPVVLSGGLTVNQGGSVSFGASDAVTIGPPSAANTYTTLTDNGTLSFASGDTVVTSRTTATPLLLRGADRRRQRRAAPGHRHRLQLHQRRRHRHTPRSSSTPAAHLQASSSTFAVGHVDLIDRRRVNAGDLTGDAFDSPLYIPAIDVQYLSAPHNNLRFQAIYVQADTIISGQSVALNSIGTQTTTNLRYVFPGSLTVNQGDDVAASVPSSRAV